MSLANTKTNCAHSTFVPPAFQNAARRDSADVVLSHRDLRIAGCSAAYATDQKITNHGSVETNLPVVKLDTANLIPGTNLEVWATPVGKGLSFSLASRGHELAQVVLSEFPPGTEVKLDVPNPQSDEYVRVTCKC